MFEDLIPELQGPAADILQASGEAGLLPRVTSTRRSPAAQARLYRRWQSGLSPFPAAPPGTSAHEFGYAFDMVVTPMEALADVGYTWQSWGGIWGGERDPVHFEFPGFVVPRKLLAAAANVGVGFIPTVGTAASVGAALTGEQIIVPAPTDVCLPPDPWWDPVAIGEYLGCKTRQLF